MIENSRLVTPGLVGYGGTPERYEKRRTGIKVYAASGHIELCQSTVATQLPGWETMLCVGAYEDAFGSIRNSDDSRYTMTAEERKQESIQRVARRIRTNFRGLALSNHWDYWVTLTVDPCKVADRHDYRGVVDAYGAAIKARNKLVGRDPVRYALMLEHHQDGAYHMHGFMAGIDRKRDLRKNVNHYSEIGFLRDKMGYMHLEDMSRKSDIDKKLMTLYTLKYAVKAAETTVSEGGGKNTYLCSHGLSRGETHLIRDEQKKDLVEGFLQSLTDTYTTQYSRSLFTETSRFKRSFSAWMAKSGVSEYERVDMLAACGV